MISFCVPNKAENRALQNETETVGGRLSSDLLFLAAFWREGLLAEEIDLFQSTLRR